MTTDPKEIKVEECGRQFIVSTEDPPVYGVGDTEAAARSDYARGLEEWHQLQGRGA